MGQFARQAVAFEFQFDRIVSLVTSDAIPVTMSDVGISPIFVLRPLGSLGSFVKFLQRIPFPWTECGIIPEVEARFET